MENYKSKYIKYKSKYIMLKNKLIGGMNNIIHIDCIYSIKNSKFFLSLLLQLLIEYKVMFEIERKIKKDSISQNPFITKNEINKTNNNFLSILKFLNYTDQSIDSLLDEEQLEDTIKIIMNYCDNDMICKCDLYKEELTNNLICVEKLNDNYTQIFSTFYDSRNYSISILLNILLGEYNNWKQPPILIYEQNKNSIIEGHMFILYHPEIASLEAIGIQLSLKLLANNICNGIKTGLSIKLFNYVMNQIVPIFKSANYLYAFAWKIMSNILVQKFNFNTLIQKNFGGYLIDDKNIDIEKIDVNSYEYGLIRDFKEKATFENDLYIFTVKKICQVSSVKI